MVSRRTQVSSVESYW